MKTCIKCKIEKPKAAFSKASKSADGKQTTCKHCNKSYREDNKARLLAYGATWRESNKDYVAEKKKEYNELHKEAISARRKRRYEADRETLIARTSAYYREHKAEVLARRRARYEADKAAILAIAKASQEPDASAEPAREKTPEEVAKYAAVIARAKAWKAANPEKVKASHHLRRSRQREAEGFFTADDIIALFKKQHGCCVYCRCDISKKYHVDHIIALALGGASWPSNLQLLCPTCNTSKKEKTHLEFILYRIQLGRYVPPELIPEDILV